MIDSPRENDKIMMLYVIWYAKNFEKYFDWFPKLFLTHLLPGVALSDQVSWPDTCVHNVDQPRTQHLPIINIQQQTELAVLASTVATASPSHVAPDVTCRGPDVDLLQSRGRAVPRVLAAVESWWVVMEWCGVNYQQLVWGTGEEQLCAVTSWRVRNAFIGWNFIKKITLGWECFKGNSLM